MSILRYARKAVKSMIIMVYRVFNRVLPLKDNRIVFSSSLGKSYSGNPKAIYEKLVSEGLDKNYDCIWFYENSPYDIEGCNKQVKYGRIRYLYYMATAKFWIFFQDNRNFYEREIECFIFRPGMVLRLRSLVLIWIMYIWLERLILIHIMNPSDVMQQHGII